MGSGINAGKGFTMQALPEGAPATLNEAFALVNAATKPNLLELQLMVLAEAAGQALYGAMAQDAPNDEVKALLLANGREEMAHAHRVSRAIGAITGTDYPVPSAEENPYLTAPMKQRPVTAAVLAGLAQSEFAGDGLYRTWADNCANPQAAELCRQNGREESRHGERMMQAAALLAD